jgi:signal transduction histidine kinase
VLKSKIINLKSKIRGVPGDRRVHQVFLALAIGLEGLLVLYWTVALDPQLTRKARLTTRALAEAHVPAVASAVETLGEASDAGAARRSVRHALSRMLLLSDPQSGIPFVQGLTLELDETAIPAAGPISGLLTLSVNRSTGPAADAAAAEAEIPIYIGPANELVGILQLHGNPAYLRHFKSDVRRTFFGLAGIIAALLLVAWAIALVLGRRVRAARAELRAKEAQVIHAGRLTALGEMATGIAHELNQPLAIIRIAGDGLNRYFSRFAPDGREAAAARKIVSAVQRAAGIIDNMRCFARSDDAAADPIDVRPAVDRALSFFREQLRSRSIELTADLAADLPAVRVNPRKLEQIVVNFLSNARHAVEARPDPGETGAVRVSLTRDPADGAVVLEVSDNGIGMDEATRRRCLEPFFTTKDVGEGTGLGLSIVFGIVRESGMDLTIESAPGAGSRFRLRIPPSMDRATNERK